MLCDMDVLMKFRERIWAVKGLCIFFGERKGREGREERERERVDEKREGENERVWVGVWPGGFI